MSLFWDTVYYSCSIKKSFDCGSSESRVSVWAPLSRLGYLWNVEAEKSVEARRSVERRPVRRVADVHGTTQCRVISHDEHVHVVCWNAQSQCDQVTKSAILTAGWSRALATWSWTDELLGSNICTTQTCVKKTSIIPSIISLNTQTSTQLCAAAHGSLDELKLAASLRLVLWTAGCPRFLIDNE